MFDLIISNPISLYPGELYCIHLYKADSSHCYIHVEDGIATVTGIHAVLKGGTGLCGSRQGQDILGILVAGRDRVSGIWDVPLES